MVRSPEHFLFCLSELTMKMIVAVPVALLTFGMLGCSQQHSTAPMVDRPAAAPTTNDTNTFGESKDEAAGSAASARAANYGEPAPAADATPPAAAAVDSTAPK